MQQNLGPADTRIYNSSMQSKACHWPVQKIVATTAAVLLLAMLAFAAKQFSPPRAFHAKTYPAHDEHPMEHVTIAVDPYDMADKASIFGINYREHGLLPIQFIISNDSDLPLDVAKIKIELVTHNRSKIQPATEDDLYRRLAKIKRRGDEPSRNPLPVPLPRKGPNVGLSKKDREELDLARFRAETVAPHTSLSGFLFFDIEGISNPLAGAHLYVSDVTDSRGQELMYFDIPMEKYLTYQPPK